jgi:hypothetical protein
MKWHGSHCIFHTATVLVTPPTSAKRLQAYYLITDWHNFILLHHSAVIIHTHYAGCAVQKTLLRKPDKTTVLSVHASRRQGRPFQAL